MQSGQINITCETCHRTHLVSRTKEIPDHVRSMGCNWCPACEDRAEAYYEEWYNEDDGRDSRSTDPEPSNQLVLPFALNEILQEETINQQCNW